MGDVAISPVSPSRPKSRCIIEDSRGLKVAITVPINVFDSALSVNDSSEADERDVFHVHQHMF